MGDRVLIVDDESNIRTAIGQWLKLHGFAVEMASDGYEAVELSRKAPYNLVIMDIEMPRMNGWDAIRHIRNQQPDTRFIVLSGTCMVDDTSPGEVHRILSKPISLSELENHIRHVLQES